MKVATVNFGHIDVSFSLYKRLWSSSNISFTHFLCFALNRKSESVINFQDNEVNIGFAGNDKVKEIIYPGLIRYLGNIERLKLFIFFNLKLRSFRNFFLALWLSRELNKYDIIHFNGLNGVLPLLVFFLRKKKLVFTIHDIRPHSGDKTRFGIAKKTTDYLCRSKYPVIALNRHDYDYCQRHYTKRKTKFIYVPFGVLDIYRYIEPLEMPASDMLFFGRIARYKGLKYLAGALELLRKEGSNMAVVIAGSGPVYPELLPGINENGIKLINRQLSNEELAGLIENTKIVVCPYTDTTQSGVLMTSFALDKPVIASAIGSFNDIIIDGQNGLLFEPKNSVDLAAKIKQAFSGNLLEKMEKGVKEFTENSEEYSWDKISKKYIEFYHNYHSGEN